MGVIVILELTFRILNDNRRPMGYMDIPTLKSSFKKGAVKPDEPVCMWIMTPI